MPVFAGDGGACRSGSEVLNDDADAGQIGAVGIFHNARQGA